MHIIRAFSVLYAASVVSVMANYVNFDKDCGYINFFDSNEKYWIVNEFECNTAPTGVQSFHIRKGCRCDFFNVETCGGLKPIVTKGSEKEKTIGEFEEGKGLRSFKCHQL
ncbi:hypothetical protein GQ44DRAFT_824984 [Phaeosphaeriaceae sp. PMI808]|nr:hypothetical protein GQ44DRAFT_824984 [Phaeosphaeriaceae sp. PMI808]